MSLQGRQGVQVRGRPQPGNACHLRTRGVCPAAPLQRLIRDSDTRLEQSYKQSTGYEVPPPPSAVKRAVLYVSDIAERTGMTLVVCACAATTFVCSLHVAVTQPLVKRVVQSSVYRGLKQLPRRNDPRGLTLLVRARQTMLACLKYSLIRPLSADVGHEIPQCGGAVERAVHLTVLC